MNRIVLHSLSFLWSKRKKKIALNLFLHSTQPASNRIELKKNGWRKKNRYFLRIDIKKEARAIIAEKTLLRRLDVERRSRKKKQNGSFWVHSTCQLAILSLLVLLSSIPCIVMVPFFCCCCSLARCSIE